MRQVSFLNSCNRFSDVPTMAENVKGSQFLNQSHPGMVILYSIPFSFMSRAWDCYMACGPGWVKHMRGNNQSQEILNPPPFIYMDIPKDREEPQG